MGHLDWVLSVLVPMSPLLHLFPKLFHPWASMPCVLEFPWELCSAELPLRWGKGALFPSPPPLPVHITRQPQQWVSAAHPALISKSGPHWAFVLPGCQVCSVYVLTALLCLCKQIKLLNSQPVQSHCQRLSIQEISNSTLFPSAGAIKFHKFLAAFLLQILSPNKQTNKQRKPQQDTAWHFLSLFFFIVKKNYYSFPALINCKLWLPDGH